MILKKTTLFFLMVIVASPESIQASAAPEQTARIDYFQELPQIEQLLVKRNGDFGSKDKKTDRTLLMQIVAIKPTPNADKKIYAALIHQLKARHNQTTLAIPDENAITDADINKLSNEFYKNWLEPIIEGTSRKNLLTAKDNQGYNALFIAIRGKNTPALEKLLASPDFPLSLLTSSQSNPLMEAVNTRDQGVVQLLLEKYYSVCKEQLVKMSFFQDAKKNCNTKLKKLFDEYGTPDITCQFASQADAALVVSHSNKKAKEDNASTLAKKLGNEAENRARKQIDLKAKDIVASNPMLAKSGDSESIEIEKARLLQIEKDSQAEAAHNKTTKLIHLRKEKAKASRKAKKVKSKNNNADNQKKPDNKKTESNTTYQSVTGYSHPDASPASAAQNGE